jgi:hypothetical protein
MRCVHPNDARAPFPRHRVSICWWPPNRRALAMTHCHARRSAPREARMSALRAALIEGEESGPSMPFDFEAFIARKRKQKPEGR